MAHVLFTLFVLAHSDMTFETNSVLYLHSFLSTMTKYNLFNNE